MDHQPGKVALRKEVKEIVAGVVAAAHLDGLGRFLPRAGNALEELGVGISEGIGDRLVEEVLLDPEVNGCPQEEVVSQPVVDDLVGVLVGNNQAQLVELEADAEVVLKSAMLQSLQEKKINSETVASIKQVKLRHFKKLHN